MTPIEISEREVLAAAKAWHNVDSYGTAACLHKAVALLEERERVAGNSIPAPRPGAEPIPRRPKKLSKRDQAVEARRKSDPLGSEREDIDYSSDELPSVR